MARTSSFTGHIGFSRRTAAWATLLAATLLLPLAGCGNDNPRENGGTMTVDIRGLAQQVGSGNTTDSAGQPSSTATTEVKSLVIGAVVITFTDTPLTSDTSITTDVSDKLASDVINSINFFTIVDLPTSEDFAEFKVPPPGAGQWQVAAVGTKDQILTFDDLNKDNEAIYYGFDPFFHTTSGSTGPDVTLEMKRACFIDAPPAGCAAYGDNGVPKVTAAVKILDILDKASTASGNGTRVTQISSFPITVTDLATATSATATMKAYVPTKGRTATVVTIHTTDPNFNSTKCTSAYVNAASLDDATVKDCFGTFVSKY